MNVSELRSCEELLRNQLELTDSAVLRKKLAAVRVQLEEAEAALRQQQILETII